MNIFRRILIAGLIGAIAFSAYNAVKIENAYKSESAAHEEEMRFKPVATEPAIEKIVTGDPYEFVNQNILDLKAKYPDAIGWISVPYTGIDYPFVKAADNSVYLSKDLDGNYSTAGSLFMDCYNDKDFTDFNTIIYGHHMKNGTMFGSLKEFNDKEFFNTVKRGTVFLADKTYELEFFAFLVVPADDDIVFGIPEDKSSILSYIDHIKENARHYRDVGVSPLDRIVTLSTCAYEFDGARFALLGKIIQTE